MDELLKIIDQLIDCPTINTDVEFKPVIKKVAICIPLKGHSPPKAYNDRMLMAFQLGQTEMEQRLKNEPIQYIFYWFFAGELFVPYARENLANMALKYECDYLFSIDDDMLAPPDLFYRLVKHDVDIVAALAFTRNPPYNPVICTSFNGFDPVTKQNFYTHSTVKNYPRNTLVECDSVGFGAVLIKTAVFRGIPEPRFMSSNPSGEDVLFCTKAKEKGFRVFMDTSIKLGHLGDSVVITEGYADEFNKMDEAEREKLMGKYSYPSLEKAR